MIPLFKPYMPALPELTEILNSGSLSYGNYGRLFEKRLAEYIGSNNVIVTNSFNMAILVALSSIGVGIGDEVLLSPMACLASTQPLLAAGIRIKWADIDPLTGTLCPKSVKNSITCNTKAIIHNHYCGFIGYIDEINEIGKAYAIPVIDDCIEAFGGEYKGKRLGNVGTDVTVFSFNAVRIPNTIDGGAVVFGDVALYNKSILVRDCGIDRRIFRDDLGEINSACDISMIGHSATMSEMNSYIGIRQMEHVEDLLKKQRTNAKKWDSYLFTHTKDLIPIQRNDSNPNYWVYGLFTDNKRETMLAFRELGFYSSSVHLRNDRYTIFGEQVELSGVKAFSERFLAIPCGWWFDLNSVKSKESTKG